MSERLISQLQSFLDRLKNDSRSALMFEADADTLREAMARIKSDGMKVDHMMNEADKDVIRIAALERDLAAAQQDKGLAELAMRQKAERLTQCEEALAAAQGIIKDHESGVENLNRTMRGLMDDLAAAQAERDERQDMANVGEALMETIKRNLSPHWSWNDCPSEVVVDLINERDEARAEAAALRVDAERYRWLRMNRLWLKANLPMIAAPELDAAIDQARGAA